MVPAAIVTARETAAKSPRPCSHSKRDGQPASGHGMLVADDPHDDRAGNGDDADASPGRRSGAGRGRSRAPRQRPRRPASTPIRRRGRRRRSTPLVAISSGFASARAIHRWRSVLRAPQPERSPRRSRTARAMHASTARTVSTSAMLSGVLRVPAQVDLGRPGRRRDPPAVEPAVDELRGSEVPVGRRRGRSLTVGDLADHDSWKPSPSTSQHPSGQLSTMTVRLRRSCDVDGHRGRVRAIGSGSGARAGLSTTRSTVDAGGRAGVVVSRWAPSVEARALPARTDVAATASPASRSAVGATI